MLVTQYFERRVEKTIRKIRFRIGKQMGRGHGNTIPVKTEVNSGQPMCGDAGAFFRNSPIIGGNSREPPS